jgi:hypothetical protein
MVRKERKDFLRGFKGNLRKKERKNKKEKEKKKKMLVGVTSKGDTLLSIHTTIIIVRKMLIGITPIGSIPSSLYYLMKTLSSKVIVEIILIDVLFKGLMN